MSHLKLNKDSDRYRRDILTKIGREINRPIECLPLINLYDGIIYSLSFSDIKYMIDVVVDSKHELAIGCDI
jgi:hypothetical protein